MDIAKETKEGCQKRKECRGHTELDRARCNREGWVKGAPEGRLQEGLVVGGGGKKPSTTKRVMIKRRDKHGKRERKGTHDQKGYDQGKSIINKM